MNMLRFQGREYVIFPLLKVDEEADRRVNEYFASKGPLKGRKILRRIDLYKAPSPSTDSTSMKETGHV